jgi:CRP-like cAMP-binding protein
MSRARGENALRGGNRILAGVPAVDYRRLRRVLQPVALRSGRVLLQQGGRSPHVYFLATGVCSIARTTGSGRLIEIAMVGSDGLVGVDALFDTPSFCRATMRIGDDHALAMPVADFHREMNRRGTFAALVTASAGGFVTSLMQSIACSALHSVEQRCARWLLAMRDHVGDNEFPFTQESLAGVLGVRRPTVTLAVAGLRRKGLIAYGGGGLRVLDPGALSGVTCECYGVLKLRTGIGRNRGSRTVTDVRSRSRRA